MQAFTTSHKDPLTSAAAAILFTEDLAAVEKKVKELKVGDKTNFGVVKEIGSNFISFKARDTGVTKIAFNQRKMGSKDFVLDKLMKINENVIEEGVFSSVLKKAVLAMTSAKDVADGWYAGADSEMKKLKSSLTHDNVEKFVAASLAMSRVRDIAAKMKSGKAAMDFLGDQPKIAALIKKHTEEILKKGVLNMKESVELTEATDIKKMSDSQLVAWLKKNWSDEPGMSPMFGALLKKAAGEARSRGLKWKSLDSKNEDAELKEGIDFKALSAASKQHKFSDEAIDAFVKAAKAKKYTDKQINAMLMTGKLKVESLEEQTLEEQSPILRSVGYKDANYMFNSLLSRISPTGSLAKSIAKEIGPGFINDFKKMHNHVSNAIEIWDEIQKDLSMS